MSVDTNYTPPQKRDELTEYRISQLEKADEKKEVRIKTLELWQSTVAEKVKANVESDSSGSNKDWWIKVIIMILTGMLGLITYITQKGS